MVLNPDDCPRAWQTSLLNWTFLNWSSLQELLEAFYNLHLPTKEVPHGTGLTLVLSLLQYLFLMGVTGPSVLDTLHGLLLRKLSTDMGLVLRILLLEYMTWLWTCFMWLWGTSDVCHLLTARVGSSGEPIPVECLGLCLMRRVTSLPEELLISHQLSSVFPVPVILPSVWKFSSLPAYSVIMFPEVILLLFLSTETAGARPR